MDRARILVVDDDPNVQSMLLRMLEKNGYYVETASSGQEGLQRLKNGRFQLVLCDLMMPGFSGAETLNAIKLAQPLVEVIMMTGNATVDSAVAAMKAGAYHFVAKPVDLDELAPIMEKAIEKTRLRSILSVYETSRAVFRNLTLDALLPITVHLAAEALSADDASVMLLSAKGELEVAAVYGLMDEKRWAARVMLGERVAGKVVEQRQPVLITGPITSDPRFEKVSALRAIRSSIIHPLIADGMVLGVFNVNRTTKEEPYNSADLHVASVLSQHIAQAIANARVFGAIKDEQARFAAIFERMRDGVVLTDPSGAVLLANGAARRLLNMAGTAESAIAHGFSALNVQPSINTMLASPDVVAFEAVREQPHMFVLSGTVTPIMLDALGFNIKMASRLFVFRDITEERQQQQIKHSFLSLISHKLRTPLASIVGYAQFMLEDKGSETKEQRLKATSAIVAQAKKLNELMDKLLRFVALENLATTGIKRAEFDLPDLIESTIREMHSWLTERRASVLFESSLKSNASGDPELIKDAIKALIENAIKFNTKPDSKALVRCQETEQGIEVSIVDYGPGIAPEDQERIFGQFYQVEPTFTGQIEGLGLGLAFVRRIIEHHGGKIQLRSQLGEGTTVAFTLPRAQEVRA